MQLSFLTDPPRRVRKPPEVSESDKPAKWLNNNLPYSYIMNLEHPEAKRRSNELLDTLTEGKRKRRREWTQKQTDTEIICANLLEGGNRNQPISISMSPNSYIESRASYFTPELVHLLHEGSWIGYKPGVYARVKEERKMSRIWPTKKLMEYFEPYGRVDAPPLDLVDLRDMDGNSISYQDTPDTIRTRELIRHGNEINRKAQVQLKTSRGFDKYSTDLHAVYNITLEQGGRLYTNGNGYQCLPKTDRAALWIDRKPTVELDYSGLHPRLLYAQEGIQYDADPYTAVHPNAELRPFLKLVLLTLINCDSEATAASTCNLALKENWDIYGRPVKNAGVKVTEIIQRYKQAHPQIAHHFCTGAGLTLMNKDSKIALDILNTFAGQQIPILVMHDSFIVQQQHRDRLQYTMEDAYKRHTGGYTCPIK
jgi:hypothetical protein